MVSNVSAFKTANPNTEIEVYDVWNLNYPDSVDSNTEIDFTPSRCMIAAQWKVTNAKGAAIVRYVKVMFGDIHYMYSSAL